jgi:hypothetical protein
MLMELVCAVRAVIACRVTPAQKADIVRNVKVRRLRSVGLRRRSLPSAIVRGGCRWRGPDGADVCGADADHAVDRRRRE